ncbi:MAG: ATP-binding protein, partial [Clostridium sp.]|nr:ATP-binding protein [Clostridium sp.]
MSLSNTQYESIMRGYQRRQLANHQLMMERREAVFAKIPSFPSVSGLSVAYSHMLLRGESIDMKEYRDNARKLTLQKEQLLLDQGFPKDYLDPIYDCELCRDSGFLASGEKCACFLRQELSYLYQQSNLNESLMQDNFSTLSYAFHQGEDLVSFRKAVVASLEFAQDFPHTTRNLLFYGKVGTGKSFLSGCIAADVMEKGYGVLYFSSAYLFETLAHYTFDGKDKEN